MSHARDARRALQILLTATAALVLALGMSLGTTGALAQEEDPDGEEFSEEQEAPEDGEEDGDDTGLLDQGEGGEESDEDGADAQSVEGEEDGAEGDDFGDDEADAQGVEDGGDAPEDEGFGDDDGDGAGDEGAEDDTEVMGESLQAEDETAEEIPEGGVDAGFGGTAAGAGSGGLAVPHAAAAGLLVLALAGHALYGRSETA